MKYSTGRIPSLLAWGLLVGGISLFITFPEIRTDGRLFIGAVPAALLFVLAGLVFGLTHPEGRVWIGALLFGWVPAVAALVSLFGGRTESPALSFTVLILAPAVLSGLGAAMGAVLARWRNRTGTPDPTA